VILLSRVISFHLPELFLSRRVPSEAPARGVVDQEDGSMTNEQERDRRRAVPPGNEDQGMRDDEIQAEQDENVRKHLGKAAPERRARDDVRGGDEPPTTVHGGNQGHGADASNPGSSWRGS
ncbi:MAG: hypothetical protein DIU71_02885, partial [Proteobacteria bacterium]